MEACSLRENPNIIVISYDRGTSAPTTQVNLVVDLQKKDKCLLIDLLNPDEISFDFFKREIQTKEEILSFLDYLEASGEGEIEFLGSTDKRQDMLLILPFMRSYKKNIRTVSELRDYVAALISKLLYSYQIYEYICNLPLQNGDIITLSRNNVRISEEKVVCLDNGKYMLLPTEWDVLDEDEEVITHEDLCDYLFHLIIEENHSIIYTSALTEGNSSMCLRLELRRQPI